jgi:hypothetical protein
LGEGRFWALAVDSDEDDDDLAETEAGSSATDAMLVFILMVYEHGATCRTRMHLNRRLRVVDSCSPTTAGSTARTRKITEVCV